MKTRRYRLIYRGSEQYIINHNGKDYFFDISDPEIDLLNGLNFIEVRTDKIVKEIMSKRFLLVKRLSFIQIPPLITYTPLYIMVEDTSVDL